MDLTSQSKKTMLRFGKKQPLNMQPTQKAKVRVSDEPDFAYPSALESLSLSDAKWKDLNKDNVNRVQVKEKAVKDAIVACKGLIEALKENLLLTPSCQARIDKINTVLNRKNNHQILVGFLGVTGSGKTTLINALIGSQYLLPASIWRACTAVSVEISWNTSNDISSQYRAEVDYITSEEWFLELQSFFEDINSEDSVSDSEDNDDDTEDTERKARIKETFDKIKCIYPKLKKLDQLYSSSAEELVDDPAVRDVLGSTIKIKHANKKEFAAEIMIHIDSGNSNGAKSARWPLVKLVKVFVKSPFLAHGITLVDLPGNSDNNAGRSAIAENYQKGMSVTCILTPAKRGIDDKNAHELLERVAKRNLQLDGLYNSESLCVVISQTDDNLDVRAHINSNPALEEKITHDNTALTEHKNQKGALEKEIDAATTARKVARKNVKELSTRVRSLKPQLGEGSRTVSSNRKRAANGTFAATRFANEKLVDAEAGLSNAHCEFEEAGDKLDELKRRLISINGAIFWDRSRIRVACIKDRNALSAAAVRQDFDNTLAEMGRTSSVPLSVFCTASQVYLEYLKKRKDQRHPAFPNREDTEVPALRDWLIATTFKTRESYAQAFLEDVETMLLSIRPWINNQLGDQKMPMDSRLEWEPRLKDEVGNLQKELSSLSFSTSKRLKREVGTALYSAIPDAETAAASKAVATVSDLLLLPPPILGQRRRKMHWSTHRALNHREGEWQDSNGVDHRWNATIALDLTTGLLTPWATTFQERFLDTKNEYVEAGHVLLTDFANFVSSSDVHSGISENLRILADNVTRTKSLLDVQAIVTFQGVTAEVKRAHRAAVPAIKRFLAPMYETCANEGGEGHFARNKRTHRQTMLKKGHDMHRTGSDAIRIVLDNMLGGLNVKFEATHTAVIDQIRDEVEQFFVQNSTSGNRLSSRKVVSQAKIKLQADLQVIITQLGNDWRSELAQKTQNEWCDGEEEEEDSSFQTSEFVSIEDLQDSDYSE